MRMVAKHKDGFCNLPADSLTERDGMVFVHNGDKLVGVYDLGVIDMIYLSDKER